MVTVEWKGGMAFEALPESGAAFVMDAYPESGGSNQGPTPVEALLSSIAACSAMDVISILHKAKQQISSYKIEVTGERGPQGVFPRPFLSIDVKHILTGESIDPAVVERAVRLSDEKYCSVMATLRHGPIMTSSWTLES